MIAASWSPMSQSAVPNYLHQLSIPTPFPVGPVNVYLAEGERLTLVDTGPRYEPAREALRKQLNQLGYQAEHLRRIVLTHAHADHCGLAAELAAEPGAEVWTHGENVDRLSADGNGQRLAFYARLMRWAGVPLTVMMRLAKVQRGLHRYAEPVAPDHLLADGDGLEMGGEVWQVLHTPGHTGGLICLYQPERHLLLSSDHLLRDISSNAIVDPPPSGGTQRPRRLVEYLSQLRRVAQLDVGLTLPGHGPPITDHRALIQERLAFHEERGRRILETLGNRYPTSETLTAYQIAEALFPELDPVDTFLAISEVIGHLQWLESEGQVDYEDRGGTARWARVE
jgi:glyoxylase-like metal-dependent hydrolase (beta-lactamase superfamily II)